MNIIEQVKDMLMRFPKINEIVNDIHVDFTDSSPSNYGLTSSGDALLQKDILGNELRQHTFVLYAVWQSVNDYDRMSNSGALLELAYWLEDQREVPIANVKTANGMLYAIPNSTESDLWQYQIQIIVEYERERN